MTETSKDWQFYIITNNGCTYAGVSPDPVRRLRQHNGEINGGAKYTTSKGPGWRHLCLISGFTKIHALQFEWAVKHYPPRDAGGIINRLKKLICVINKEKWTSKSPDSSTVPLTINWLEKHNIGEYSLPDYVTETCLL
jgi:structure-specific endonuclease subunit SLX1